MELTKMITKRSKLIEDQEFCRIMGMLPEATKTEAKIVNLNQRITKEYQRIININQ